ncbi:MULTISPECIES: YggT family protein [Furfurilactobacillus]|uniref:YggT family protein n=2 Tax=Furfurilactobacillus TaxID=2767882 RepID=A0A6N9I754_9LACO|nr:YggT family protein [Furfurilactobacillus milii]MYV18113.1 YggT family protein [Furfurilactobacillus milii]
MISFLFTILNWGFELYTFAIIVYVLLSWFPGAYATSFGQFLARICEPYLRLFDFIPPIFGLSFAPVVAIIVLGLVQYGLFGVLSTVTSF